MTWETIESWDIGLDFGLLDNRLTGSVGYYNRYTYDMLIISAAAPLLQNHIEILLPPAAFRTRLRMSILACSSGVIIKSSRPTFTKA